jgi:hypothetical protein
LVYRRIVGRRSARKAPAGEAPRDAVQVVDSGAHTFFTAQHRASYALAKGLESAHHHWPNRHAFEHSFEASLGRVVATPQAQDPTATK